MRTFLIKLTIFLGIGLASYLALLLSVDLLSRKAAEHCRLGPDIDSVIAGDSHMMWSIDDAAIPGLRNISLNAEAYKYTFEKLVFLLDREPQVRHVYLGVGHHNFAAYYDDFISGASFKFFAYRYLPVLSLRDFLTVDPFELPALAKLLVAKGLEPALGGHCELYGSFPSERQTKVYDPKSMEKRIQGQYFFENSVTGPSSSNVAYLQKIVDLCRDRGVEVTILNSPVHPDYERAVPRPFKKMLDDFLSRNHLAYYDFHDLRLSDEDFLPDGDHLNYDGAQLTTERFLTYHLSQSAGPKK